MSMFFIVMSAALVGFIHSLAPGHWLPVVLLVKARKWSIPHAGFAAAVAASGHIIISVGLGILAHFIGIHFMGGYLHEVEEKAGWILIVFGLIYAIFSRFSHRHCHGHEHHGPNPKKTKAPYIFLLSLGLSPCFAVLPVFGAAVGFGNAVLILSMVSFSLGVLGALVGSSMLAALGILKLDHPIFEHYGDVLVGLGVALMGVFLLVFPHTHVH